MNDVEELREYVGSVGAVSALYDCGEDILELPVIDALEIGATVLRTVSVTSVPTFVVMALAAPSFAPIMAWWMRLRQSASS